MNADFPASRAVCFALTLLCAAAMAEPEAGKTADAAKEKDKKEEKKERVPSVIPSHLMQLAQKSSNTVLQWSNGQSLDGELLSLENGVLTWKSPLFTDALKLKAEALRRIDFGGKVSVPAGTFRFVLADGSHLTGDLTAASTDTLTLRSDRTGEIALRRDQVVRLERISGGPLVRDASAAPAAWSDTSRNSNGEMSGSWYMAPGGLPATPSFNQTMYLKEKLPEKVEIEIMLRTDERPDIALSLGSGSSAVRLETWENEIVLLEGSRFVPSTQKLTDQTRSLHLRLTWDRTAGKATLFSADGTVWCELTPEAKKPDEAAKPKEKKGGWLAGLRKKLIDDVPPEPSPAASQAAPEGVMLISRCPGLIVERLAVRSWNGNPLPALAPALPGVETDSGIIPGEVTAVQDGKFTIRAADGTEKQVPADEVRSIRRMEPAFPKPTRETVELWYADGALLRGRFTAARDGRVTVENPCVTAPVSAKIEGARSIRFALPDKEEEAKLETLDTLSVGGRVLHGSMVFSGAALPAFQPTGALEAMVPASAKEVILSRALPKDTAPKLSTAFLHLEGDQTIPAELHTVDRNRITFAAPGAEVKELPASAVHAVQFAPGELTGHSFSDPGWTATGKGVKRTKTQVTLEAGGGIFHPLMSQGTELQFKMKTVDSMGSIRVRLYTQGADRPLKSSMNLLIADYGGTVYCGEESSEGQMNERGDINVKHGQPVTVKILLSGQDIVLEINGQDALRLQMEGRDKRRAGHGLVIESAGVWGQNPASVKLSDFTVKLGAYQISAPFFTEEARKEALLLPRFRREDRPRHVLIGVNGDLLRGEIEGMTTEHIGFRSGMESFQVPRSRVTAAVWVLPPEKKAPEAKADEKKEAEAPPPDPQGLKLSGLLKKLGAKKTEKKEEPAAGEAPAKVEPDVWLSLTNGGQIALKGDKFAAEAVTGTHPMLGRMTIPSALIQQVRTSTPGGNAASSALSSWRFELTPDPVIPSDEGGDASPLDGKPAPDFKVPLLAGGDFTLAGAKGKVVVLDFWATWCGPCIQSLPGLMQEMAQFPEDKVVFLTLNQGESKDKVQKFLETRGWKMPVGMDADTGVAKKYAVEGIPHSVVIGPDGKVIFVKTGFSPECAKQIAEAVNKAMGGASPAPEKEKEEKPEPEKKPEPKKEEKADDPDIF